MGDLRAAAGCATISGLLAGVGYLFGMPPKEALFLWFLLFAVFAFNMARAETKLILDKETPGWRERNALWTSTWDWNRKIKRQPKHRQTTDRDA
jgi:hypothetical protein